MARGAMPYHMYATLMKFGRKNKLWGRFSGKKSPFCDIFIMTELAAIAGHAPQCWRQSNKPRTQRI